jgi:DNA-binding IclR family transcriptional regulator
MSLIWSATGRLFLALLDESRVRKLAQEELASSPADLRAQLDETDPIGALQRQVRAAGCSIVRDTNLKGISAVAAPLFDANGHLCAALTALGATGGFDSSIDGPIARALREEAGKISGDLGYRTASPP